MERTEAVPPVGTRLEVPYPERLSRLHLLAKTFLGWLYVGIPHELALYVLGIIANVVQLVALVAILITGRYPRGLFNFMEGYLRWGLRVIAYWATFLTDSYPPFSIEPGRHPVRFEVEYPERLSRLLALAKYFLGWLYVLIPHGLALLVYGVVVAVALVVAWFAVLFTGRYPRGIFNLVVGLLRWSYRVNVYLYLMRDEYPPFHGRP